MIFGTSIKGYEHAVVVNIDDGQVIVLPGNFKDQLFTPDESGVLIPGEHVTLNETQRKKIKQYGFDYLASCSDPKGSYPDAWRISHAKQHTWKNYFAEIEK